MKTTKNNPAKKRGGYQLPRNTEGNTPRQRLDAARAEAVEFENRRKREHWQTREEAEAAAAETASIIGSDLFGTLPLELAGRLSGRVFTPAEARLIVRAAVDSMVRAWIRGERVSASSIPAS
jgi:hypothetical protein